MNAIRIETNNLIASIEDVKAKNQTKTKREKKVNNKKMKFNKNLLKDIIDSKSLTPPSMLFSTHSNSTFDTIDLSSKSSSA